MKTENHRQPSSSRIFSKIEKTVGEGRERIENGIPLGPLPTSSFHVAGNGRNGPPCCCSPASFTTWKRWQHHPDGESPWTKRKEWWCTYRGARGRGLSRRSLSRQRRWRRPPRRPPCRRASCSFLDPYFCLPVSTPSTDRDSRRSIFSIDPFFFWGSFSKKFEEIWSLDQKVWRDLVCRMS